jgi:hypothetical protein
MEIAIISADTTIFVFIIDFSFMLFFECFQLLQACLHNLIRTKIEKSSLLFAFPGIRPDLATAGLAGNPDPP